MAEPGPQESRKSMQGLKSQGNLRSVTGLKSETSRLKMRRKSFGFSMIPSVRPIEKTSQIAFEFKRPPLIYLPTFQLDPSVRFNSAALTIAANEILDEAYGCHVYNAQESPSTAMRISIEVMRKAKSMQFNRYRIISVVTIGHKRAQCYNNAISFVWDHERDNYCDLQRETNTSFIHVTVFGVYLD